MGAQCSYLGSQKESQLVEIENEKLRESGFNKKINKQNLNILFESNYSCIDSISPQQTKANQEEEIFCKNMNETIIDAYKDSYLEIIPKSYPKDQIHFSENKESFNIGSKNLLNFQEKQEEDAEEEDKDNGYSILAISSLGSQISSKRKTKFEDIVSLQSQSSNFDNSDEPIVVIDQIKQNKPNQAEANIINNYQNSFPLSNLNNEEISFQTLNNDEGIKYQGQLKGQQRHGFGVQIWPDKSKYQGEWENNRPHGNGMLTDSQGCYQGQWEKGKIHGVGAFIKSDGSQYVGSWKNDLEEGFGDTIWKDGTKYSGHFKEGKKHGFGTYTWTEGQKYSGEWFQGTISGKGTYWWTDGRKYEKFALQGEWLNNYMHGKGVFTWPEGRKYEGEYEFDKKHGYGVLTLPDGKQHQGYWQQGVQHGKGKYILPDKSEVLGVWERGKMLERVTNQKVEDLSKKNISSSKKVEM